MIFALLLIAFAIGVGLTVNAQFSGRPLPGCTPWRQMSRPTSRGRRSNANEPDVFASADADLDPESDTGEPKGWN